ncbi:MAG: transglycosylase domain-containing protein [bacterium]|nr:transglycosylase domain-containing protein [bacterium]
MYKLVKKYFHYVQHCLKEFRFLMRDKRCRERALGVTAVGLFITCMLLYAAEQQLMKNYKNLESVAIEDRKGTVLTVSPNSKSEYGRYEETFSPRVKEWLIKKEDRFFYFHPGINPLSTLRATFRYVTGHRVGGASTITQQLVKNLLSHEQNRSIINKFVEMFYALAIELFTTKEQILTMYANTIYMGNQTQGLTEASKLYFGKKLDGLDDTKLAMLLATISSPSIQNPWRDENARVSRNLALKVGVVFDPSLARVVKEHDYAPLKNFELASMGETCASTCKTTLDGGLTERLRDILNKHVLKGWDAGARNGAIVVIKLPENELLAIVGTPDKMGFEAGQQINMAIQPRPIGSTAKPFIYLAGFEKGLRPYTLVDDREYKFPTAAGFPLYPKNYDGTYRGWITLHTALSNSLNVPTVKTLQYVGLSNFYDFLEHKLNFKPLQDLDSYQYGIALGGLEMDALTLAHYLTLFPEDGVLKPLRLFLEKPGREQILPTPMSELTYEKKIVEPGIAQLVSKVLNDRITGVEQFGLASNLNLFQDNYAVKTGTSRDYHDSWTVGYTPDFLVVTWLGNVENTPLKHVTGQSGAGAIWNDSMELLLNSEYNKETPLAFDKTQDIVVNGSIDFGLPGDVVAEHRNLLRDDSLISSPQKGDTFLLESQTDIPLVSPQNVSWYANDQYLGQGTKLSFYPPLGGDYTIKATNSEETTERVLIHVISR